MYHVYKITNKHNGRYYIGVHKTDDFEASSYMGSGPLIKKAIQKYGKDSFIRESLYAFEDAQRAYDKEREIIDLSDDLNYNLNSGGLGGFDYINSLDLPNPMHNPESVFKNQESNKKTRSSNKAYYDDVSRSNLQKAVEAVTGVKQSEERVQKRAEYLREYYKTHDHHRKGSTNDEEHNQKIADSWTEERKRAKSEWMKERIAQNPDITKTNLGKKFSDKVKANISAACIESWKHRAMIECPHCKLSSKNAVNMKRWHFDNCKDKQ